MSYRAVASGGPAGRGKCGSTEAVHFLRSRVQAARLQGRAGRSRVEVKQRVLQRNDGCVRREPPSLHVSLHWHCAPYPCASMVCQASLVFIHVRGSEVDTSAIITLYLFFPETESLPEAGAHQSDYLTSGLQGSCACTSTPQHRLQAHTHVLAFSLGTGDLSSGSHAVWQAKHTFNPRMREAEAERML